MDLGSAPQAYQPASSTLSLGHSQPPGGPPAPQITFQREGAIPPLPSHAQNQLPIFLASAQPHQPAQPQQLQHQLQHQHQGFAAHQGAQMSQQPSAQSHLPGHQPIIFNMQHLHTQPHPQSQPQPGPSHSLQAQPPLSASQPQAVQPAASAQEAAHQEPAQPAQAAAGHRERDNFGLVCRRFDGAAATLSKSCTSGILHWTAAVAWRGQPICSDWWILTGPALIAYQEADQAGGLCESYLCRG